MKQQSVDEGRISRGTLRRETDTLTASSRQFHRTGDDMRRLAPLQPTEGLASPRTARPVMPHLAHNYNYGWHPPAQLQTTDAFYGSGWSNPRTLDIEHVISRAPHALLPTHGPRPTSLAACSRWPSAAPQLGSCAFSGRAWRLWAAQYSQKEADSSGCSASASGARVNRLQSHRSHRLRESIGLGMRAISVSTHKREHVHLADNRARNAYLRPHTALRRQAAEQEREP